jgi:hypothetical protein
MRPPICGASASSGVGFGGVPEHVASAPPRWPREPRASQLHFTLAPRRR